MDHYIDQVGQFIQSNQEWAGLITFLLTFGESLIVIGLLIPATALLLLTGGLVGAGTLNPWTILAWGMAGAILGDAVSYWLGRWCGPGILHRWPLKQQRPAVARARLFFFRYGLAAVIMGRFLGPLRSTVPTVAGVMRMHHGRFQLANILSAIAWMPLMLAPGYLTARGLEHAQGKQGFSLMVGVVASIVIGTVLLYALFRKRRQTDGARNAR